MNRIDALLRQLGIRHPIIQAPMAGVSTPALAAAVSNAGALGSLGVGASTAAQSREMILATRALTDRPFNVNLFCHRPAVADAPREAAWLGHLAARFAELGATPPGRLNEIYTSFVADPAMQALLLELRPAVVSFHFGLPDPAYIAALKAAGIVTLATATSPDEAAQIEAAGVDAIVAQGVEAGGHRGCFDPAADSRLGTFALVRLLATRGRLPIIAAGGIMDGAGIAAAMQLGAAAVQLGTAFVTAPESAANAAYRAAFATDRAHRTAITAAISGRPARGMPNRLFTELDRADAPPVPDYPTAYDAAKALVAAAAARGNGDFAVQWAGQGAPLARTMPAAALVATLVEEWRAAAA